MTTRLRILVFTSLFPSPIEPQRGIFALRRAQALCAAGAEVEVIAPLGVTLPATLVKRPREAAAWVSDRLAAPQEVVLEGLPVHYPRWAWPPKALIGGLEGHLLYRLLAGWFDRAVARFRPDAILASWLPDAAAACLLGRRSGVPVIALAEGSDLVRLPADYPWWRVMRHALNTSSAFVFVSEGLRSHASAAGLDGPKEFVVHNGFDESLFIPPLRRERREEAVVLTVGARQEVKDQESLLRAVALARPRLRRPLKLVLVGDGPLTPRLVGLADELGFNGSVSFLGSRPQSELVALYQSADVFCLPSLSEGMGCVLVEAMGCGTPVVASRVGGIPELITEQTGILVPPHCPDELADGLQQALERDWSQDEIRAHALANFTWSRTGSRLLDVVERVVDAR